MSKQSVSELQAELDAIRQKLAELEAKQDDSKPASNSARRRGLSKGLPFGWTPWAIGILLTSGLVFAAGDALFIHPNGNVGIGTDVPKATLDVAGTIRSSSGGLQFPDDTTQVTAAVLTGAVIAFNLPACPAGWTEYKPAFGRFIRGIDKSGAKIDPDGERNLESVQEDAIRNITGRIEGVRGRRNIAQDWGFRPGTIGAFNVTETHATYNKYSGDYNPVDGVGTIANFDASKAPGVKVAAENRPKNVALLYCQKN